MDEPSGSKAYKEYASYWAIVWEQFKKNRPSHFALWAIVALFAIATYAPVFSSKVPFFWRDEAGLSFPWFEGLLFNRNVFQSGACGIRSVRSFASYPGPFVPLLMVRFARNC